jgi:hypothetical protein
MVSVLCFKVELFRTRPDGELRTEFRESKLRIIHQAYFLSLFQKLQSFFSFKFSTKKNKSRSPSLNASARLIQIEVHKSRSRGDKLRGKTLNLLESCSHLENKSTNSHSTEQRPFSAAHRARIRHRHLLKRNIASNSSTHF